MPMSIYINANVYMLEEEVTFEGLRASFQSAVCFDEESECGPCEPVIIGNRTSAASPLNCSSQLNYVPLKCVSLSQIRPKLADRFGPQRLPKRE